MKTQKHLILLFIIILFAIFLRFYRLSDLAVFLADQASDSSAVLNMLGGKLTLLGPISSVGGFFNGPIVYYLMLPFYWFFKGDPIAGTFFQATLSVAAIPLIYLLGKKIKNNQVGLLSAFFFSLSPLMVDYSRAAFNSYPAVFFSTLILFMINVINRFSALKVIFLGILIGFIIQMHYLTISFVILTSFYPIFFQRNLLSAKYYFSLLIGIIIGLSPFLLFEARHQFLNTHLIFKYFISQNKTSKSILNIFQIWPSASGKILFGNNYIFGAFSLLLTIVSLIFIFIKNKINKKNLTIYFFLFVTVFITGMIYGGKIQTHYIISYHSALIILFALIVDNLLKENKTNIILLCVLLLLVNAPFWNLDKKMHPLQDGLSIADFKKTAYIIKNDDKNRYNVAMHAQGDNRAMPLRYALAFIKEKPMDYTNYSDAENLYFLIRKNEELNKLTIWEYVSFGSSAVVNKWSINELYFLYKLGKKT